MKHKRRAKLLEFIEAGKVSSQSEAVNLLKAAGIISTQATVSRDLEELGAVRIRDGVSVRYGILEAGSEYGMSRSQVMGSFIVSSAISKNIIVLRTPPGHAGVVAAALDREPVEGVLGSIAGDDTVFVCIDQSYKPEVVLKDMNRIN